MMKLTGTDVLKPGQIYSYNISLTETAGGAPKALQSLKLLEDDVRSTTPAEKRRLALGYAEGQLPSFALPPDKLTDLKIIHGSCRLQVGGLTGRRSHQRHVQRPESAHPSTPAGRRSDLRGRRQGHDAAGGNNVLWRAT
jgi:hypothetical protein